MIFCLVGAHRVGKTTLMREFAKQTGGRELALNLGAIQREIGFDSRNQSYSFEHRLKVQEYLIERMAEIFEKHKDVDTIADRSPVDVIAYTLVHAGDATTAEESARLEKLIKRCVEVAEKYCVGCLLVQPGIPLVEENETSGKCSAGFIEHLNTLCFGLLNDERLVNIPMFYISRSITKLDERVKVCKSAVARSIMRNIERKRDMRVNQAEDVYFLANQTIH